MATVAEQIIANATSMEDDNVDLNEAMRIAEEMCLYEDQDWEQEKSFFYFIDESGLMVNNNSVETF